MSYTNHDIFDSRDERPQRPLSVSELTGQIKDLIEGTFPRVWVTGEISNCARPRSGHCYLTLKDEQAQLAAVIWRPTMARLRFELRDGMEVICRGNLGVYPPQGKYQLIVQELQPKGIGALELALRQLRQKLAAEGLFDPAHKRPLPRFVRKIAVVTSPSGAAIRDFLEVLRRRWRGADVLVVPVRVQGEGAAEEIAAAIQNVNRLRAPIDCLVVTRGGGSLEDLWAFNEEIVCRAIYQSRIPVISAIGHEIDVTLSDLVADVRALTPSEAAERVAPAAEEIAAQLAHYGRRLRGSLRARLAAARAGLEALAGHRTFRRPYEQVQLAARRLDELQAAADRAVGRRILRAGETLASLAGRLESLSPLAVLGRGYSLTRRAEGGPAIRDARSLSAGDLLRTRFGRGESVSRVEEIVDRSSPDDGR
jgi:exodeoxyribonuclease VII large subunit